MGCDETTLSQPTESALLEPDDQNWSTKGKPRRLIASGRGLFSSSIIN